MLAAPVVLEIGTYLYDPSERERFFSAQLLREWRAKYRDTLFDDHDEKFAAGPKLLAGKSWNEWKAAVVLHELTGFHALVTRYQEDKATRKRRLLAQLASPDLAALLTGPDRPGEAQGPDLIMFDPADRTRWFFCETKRVGERFTKSQIAYFPELVRRSGRPILLLTMQPAASEQAIGRWDGCPSVDALLRGVN